MARAARTAAPGGCRRRRGMSAGLADLDLHLLADLAQLGLEVLPLAHPQVVEELPLAHPPERAGGQLALLLLEVAPQVEPGEEVPALGLEPGVLLVGLRLRARPAARAGPAATAPPRSRSPRARSRAARPRGSSAPAAGRSAAAPAAGPPWVSSGVGPVGLRTSAPSSSSSWTPAVTLRLSGGSTNGNRPMSPSPSEAICRITEARLVRRISGSVNSGRDSKSSSE